MAALIEAIDVKRKMVFEFENAPWYCMEAEVNSPTARGGQTLVRLKMRNLLTNAVFDRTFRAGEKFREPDLELAPSTYLYSDGEGHHFLDQNSFETLTLTENQMAGALDFLTEGMALQVHKYNGNPIGVQMPLHVELEVAETEPGIKGDTSSGSVTKVAKLETGLEVRVPLFVKAGDKVRVATETREFAGRA
jgi:elongation factor P